MARRLPLLALPLLVLLTTGCASLQPAPPVRGPGAVFSSIDAAALDALAHCQRLADRDSRIARLRVGVVRPVPGGFTYEVTGTARYTLPWRVRWELQPTDVAHFHHAPAIGGRTRDAHYERHTPRLRRFVDERDPRHRPSYLLTPRKRVVVYRGQDEETEIARLGRGPRAGALASR